MAKKCAVTGKKTSVAGNYSNKVRAGQFNPTVKKTQKPNLQKKKIFVPELDQYITLTLSTKAWKTIQKNGPYATLKKAGLI